MGLARLIPAPLAPIPLESALDCSAICLACCSSCCSSCAFARSSTSTLSARYSNMDRSSMVMVMPWLRQKEMWSAD